MLKKRIISLFLAFFVMCGFVVNCFADTLPSLDDNFFSFKAWNINFVPFDSCPEINKGFSSSDILDNIQNSFGSHFDGDIHSDYYYYFNIIPRGESRPYFIFDFFLFKKSTTNSLIIDTSSYFPISNYDYTFTGYIDIVNNSLDDFGYYNDFGHFDHDITVSSSSFGDCRGFITNFDDICVDGNFVTLVSFSLSADKEKHTVDLTCKSHADVDLKFRASIHNQSSDQPCEANMIPYTLNPVIVEPDSSGTIHINMQDFIDKCSEKKSYSNNIYFYVSASGSGGIFEERFFPFNLETDLFDQDNESDPAFSKKKKYKDFPSLSDYIDTDFPNIRDYVDFSLLDGTDGDIIDFIVAIFKFCWSCFTGFFKWLWACLKFCFFNLIGLFKWLGACLWTIIQNIGIALYNLVVDIRRLLNYLFIPNSDNINKAVEDKCPAFSKIKNAIDEGKENSSSNTYINLFGKSYEFNFSKIPSDLKSALYTGSTIALYVIQGFLILKTFFKIFGVHTDNGGDDT